MIRLGGVKMGEACTIVLRGATNQILDEADRSLHDALCVLTQTVKETRTVFGGGKKGYLCPLKVFILQDYSFTKIFIYHLYGLKNL